MPSRNFLLLLGDFNAQLACDPVVTGPHCLPAARLSDNAQRLQQLMASAGLVAANTYFAKPPSAHAPFPHATFFSNNPNHLPCTYDYVMVRRRFVSSVKDVTVHHPRPGRPALVPWFMDHRMVTAQLRLRLSRSYAARHGPASPRRFYLGALEDAEAATAFKAAVQRRLPQLQGLPDGAAYDAAHPLLSPEEEDDRLTEALLAAAEETLGRPPPRRHPRASASAITRAREVELSEARARHEGPAPDAPARPAARFRLARAEAALKASTDADYLGFLEDVGADDPC